jgi:hypothetical protein
MNKRFSLRRGGPDLLTEELINAFSGGKDIEFKPLFDLVYANLRARKAAHGGEEMLRLRIYERLQSLVLMGGVDKTGKTYRKNPERLRPLTDQLAARHCRELLDAARHATPERSSLEFRVDGLGEGPIFPQQP